MTTQLPPEVQLATLADLPAVFAVMMENYEENGVYTLNKEKVAAWAMMACNQDHAVIGLIKGPTGEIEAACAVFLGCMWYSDDPYIEEIFNYVRPNHRKTTHAKHLIEFMKWFAESLGIPALVGIMTTKRLAAKERLYGRQLTKIGALFLHGMPWVAEELAASEHGHG